jgi:hypothetical protein
VAAAGGGGLADRDLGPSDPGAFAAEGDVAPLAWRRHLYVMLDAYRAERATPLPVAALNRGQMERATARLNRVP